MSDDPPGFPPPRGHEGYRDAAAPGVDAIDDPETSRRHVVAKLADDPEHPQVESLHPGAREEKPPNMRRVVVAFVMLLVVLVSAIVIGRVLRPHAINSRGKSNIRTD